MPQDELFRLYQTHDLLLFPSLHDSGGFVALEALAHGMPIVCLDLGGPGDLETSDCGIVVEIAGPFFRDVLTTIMRLAGPEMAEDVLVGRANILIASPRRITAYHIDSDVNYLLQVAGDKSFAVFDHTDRTLITEGAGALLQRG